MMLRNRFMGSSLYGFRAFERVTGMCLEASGFVGYKDKDEAA